MRWLGELSQPLDGLFECLLAAGEVFGHRLVIAGIIDAQPEGLAELMGDRVLLGHQFGLAPRRHFEPCVIVQGIHAIGGADPR